MTADPFSEHRAVLENALTRALDSLSTSHVVLLNQQLASSGHRDAGLLCLLTADALGAPAGSAEPAAVALTLLDAMGDTFASLDDGDAALARYGMPRALNAGDGFYALAQSALLHAGIDAAPDDQLAAIELLDSANELLAGELQLRLSNPGTRGAPSLLLAAMALAARAAGATNETVVRLSQGDIASASLPIEARAKIEAALQYEAPGA